MKTPDMLLLSHCFSPTTLWSTIRFRMQPLGVFDLMQFFHAIHRSVCAAPLWVEHTHWLCNPSPLNLPLVAQTDSTIPSSHYWLRWCWASHAAQNKTLQFHLKPLVAQKSDTWPLKPYTMFSRFEENVSLSVHFVKTSRPWSAVYVWPMNPIQWLIAKLQKEYVSSLFPTFFLHLLLGHSPFPLWTQSFVGSGCTEGEEVQSIPRAFSCLSISASEMVAALDFAGEAPGRIFPADGALTICGNNNYLLER